MPTTVLVALAVLGAASAYTNVQGGELQRCSGEGMALTGFTRNGHCVDQYDDHGSHHICINMASNKGGNFVSATPQPCFDVYALSISSSPAVIRHDELTPLRSFDIMFDAVPRHRPT